MSMVQTFLNNKQGFIKAHKVYFAVFLVAILADGLSTIYFMTQDPYSDELHPGIELAAKILGPVVGPLLGAAGKTTAALLVAIYLRRWAKYIFITASILSFWAAWYNIWGYELYTPLFLKYIPW
ncbi:MAG: hypothetical protein JW709_05390 [Sedimentisphaerales bacterium]|nr:hypothetical protein [Sedimentisphaerales bacterium]